LYRRDFGLVEVELSAVASRTGSRAESDRKDSAEKIGPFVSFAGADATQQLLRHGVDAVCVATPDDRHFESARMALEAGKHMLIDFTFGTLARSASKGWRLARITCNGQRGLVGSPAGNTWDSVQLQIVYAYFDGREAAFDIHTSWVTPDNFPGYVDQEVQFRFDNGVWNGHSRKRGIECTVEGRTPVTRKININNHYNGMFLEPWGERSQRGYGVEVLERF